MAEKTTVENMKDGQTGFVVPWAMWKDRNDLFWLMGDFDLEDTSEKTSELRVSKILGKYSVDTSLCRHIWDRTTMIGKNIVPIPVYELKFSGVVLWTTGTN